MREDIPFTKEELDDLRDKITDAKDDPNAIAVHDAVIQILISQDASSAKRWGYMRSAPVPAKGAYVIVEGAFIEGGAMLYCMTDHDRMGWVLGIYILHDTRIILHLIPTVYDGEALDKYDSQRLITTPIDSEHLTTSINKLVQEYKDGINVVI